AAKSDLPAALQLSFPVAFIWGAFLLDGVITAKLPDQPAEQSVLSVWQGGLDDLINFNTEVLDHLQHQLSLYNDHPLMPTVQAYWQRKPLPKPNVFEYLVVNALGEYIGKYILRKHGRLPTQLQCQRQIDLYLMHFFP
ncbi:MAG: hypothetical protein ACEQSD_01035, partial [Flavobacteriales bacterium]